MASPGADAVIVHTPFPVSVTVAGGVDPPIVQLPAADNVTGKPALEVAFALTVNGPSTPYVLVGIVAKLPMVCVACATVKHWLTVGAALYRLLPGWFALMRHVPAPSMPSVALPAE